VVKLQEENKQARRQLKMQSAELSRLEAQNLFEQALRIGTTVIVTHVFADRDPGQIRSLGKQLTRRTGVIALLGLAGDRSQFIFSRSNDAPGKMNDLLKEALAVLGSESGGGTDIFAQGVGPAANVATVQQAIEAAKNQILEELGGIG
jgi:alanyl-tRNA synthetase